VTRTAGRWTIAGAALVAALAIAPAGSAGGPVTIDRFGFWSLERLGPGAIVLHENPKTAKTQVAVRYRLPPGAREGPGHWYLIRLHFRVEVRPDTIPGVFNVAADTNARTCASIIFTVTRDGRGPIVSSDALGLVNGREIERGRGLVREIDFRNFLVKPGVKPGLNVLTFDLTSNAIPMVKEVKIFADSGIEYTRLGPASATIRAHVREANVRAGQRFHLDVTMEHQAGLHVATAVVRVQVPESVVTGTKVHRVRWNSSGPLRTTFTFRARRAGRVPLTVVANTNGFPRSAIVFYVLGKRR
jgi:hypothetical protein